LRGPVIDAGAQADIAEYLDTARRDGRLLKTVPVPEAGHAVTPALIRVTGIADLQREVFGPVLHVATYRAGEIDAVVDAINATGYGLTFGLQTRIDDRVQHVADRIEAGNIYVNRNQIGAIVGSQPFGGEGLSGTGPKAGGPLYLDRFRRHPAPAAGASWQDGDDPRRLADALAGAARDGERTRHDLPGPTGEANQYATLPRAPVLCLGPGAEAAEAQRAAIERLGGAAIVARGAVSAEAIGTLGGFSGAVWWGDEAFARALRQALAGRTGAILPLITGMPEAGHALAERHVCIDTTAAGGNAALLAGAA
jgi:RHH-type proline utilization regulon transcriptional repressor/proline dehydrogenase/delta 1-pyrroline-5-carboxylate dehydrogenase